MKESSFFNDSFDQREIHFFFLRKPTITLPVFCILITPSFEINFIYIWLYKRENGEKEGYGFRVNILLSVFKYKYYDS